jgi:predicted nucleotidyltransferase
MRARIDHPEEFDRIVRRVVEAVDPIAVYLFGSRARGDADEDSDYDLMVIVSDDFPAEQTRPSNAFALVEGRTIPIDIALVRWSRFAERSRKVGTLSFEVSQDGMVRGRRNAMLDDSDVHWHRQIKSCVGGVTAAVTGDPAVFVSVSAAHQGPEGGGPVAAIVDLG